MTFLFLSCMGNQNNLLNDFTSSYETGMRKFNNHKFAAAKESFDYVVMTNPGSSLALSARYFLAESLFNLKEYNQAVEHYNKYIKYSVDPEKILESRYKVCIALYSVCLDFMRDQTSTLYTLDRLQDFIDDYPKSKNISNIEIFIEDLRNRLARKQHQTGCLYMKIGEYDSALLYFNDTIDNYYDTIYSDKARISIIQSYLFKNEVSKAKAMLEIYKGEFRNSQYFSESQSIINDYNKKPSISDYLDLYINSSKADESQNKRDLIVENIINNAMKQKKGK